MKGQNGKSRNMGSRLSEEEGKRLAAVAHTSILLVASDSLWRTMEDEKRLGRDIDPDLKQAHTLVRRVITRWQGGG